MVYFYIWYLFNNEWKNGIVAKDVLQFYILEHGNGGGQSVFYITTDGSVYVVDVEYGDIKATKLKYKNIVSIQQSKTRPEPYATGAQITHFVDIDGNVYK